MSNCTIVIGLLAIALVISDLYCWYLYRQAQEWSSLLKRVLDNPGANSPLERQ